MGAASGQHRVHGPLGGRVSGPCGGDQSGRLRWSALRSRVSWPSWPGAAQGCAEVQGSFGAVCAASHWYVQLATGLVSMTRWGLWNRSSGSASLEERVLAELALWGRSDGVRRAASRRGVQLEGPSGLEGWAALTGNRSVGSELSRLAFGSAGRVSTSGRRARIVVTHIPQVAGVSLSSRPSPGDASRAAGPSGPVVWAADTGRRESDRPRGPLGVCGNGRAPQAGAECASSATAPSGAAAGHPGGRRRVRKLATTTFGVDGRSQVCRFAGVGLVPWPWVTASSADQVGRASDWKSPRGQLVHRVAGPLRGLKAHRVGESLRGPAARGAGSFLRERAVPRAESSLRARHAAPQVGMFLRKRSSWTARRPLRGSPV